MCQLGQSLARRFGLGHSDGVTDFTLLIRKGEGGPLRPPDGRYLKAKDLTSDMSMSCPSPTTVLYIIDISELTSRRRAQLRQLRSQTGRRHPEPWEPEGQVFRDTVPGAESQSPCDTPPPSPVDFLVRSGTDGRYR